MAVGVVVDGLFVAWMVVVGCFCYCVGVLRFVVLLCCCAVCCFSCFICLVVFNVRCGLCVLVLLCDLCCLLCCGLVVVGVVVVVAVVVVCCSCSFCNEFTCIVGALIRVYVCGYNTFGTCGILDPP